MGVIVISDNWFDITSDKAMRITFDTELSVNG